MDFSAGALSASFDALFFDLDGVLYTGPNAVPGAPEAVRQVRQEHPGLCVVYVTNNASRSAESIAEHLRELGVQAAAEEVTTSAQVAAALIAERVPAESKILVIGASGLYDALQDEGLKGVSSLDEDPVAIVQGFNPELTWRLLAEGASALWAGLPWIATNLDRTFPAAWGPAPGNGSLIKALEHATGRTPDAVAGKPSPDLFRATAMRYNVQCPLVVGDRLDTDIEGAVSGGMPSLLVFTGVSSATEVIQAPATMRPNYLGLDLQSLRTPHPKVHVQTVEDGHEARCGDAAVRASARELQLTSPPPSTPEEALDAVRAACAAAWAHGPDAYAGKIADFVTELEHAVPSSSATRLPAWAR